MTTHDTDTAVSILMMASHGLAPELIARRLDIPVSKVEEMLKPVRERLTLKRVGDVYGGEVD